MLSIINMSQKKIESDINSVISSFLKYAGYRYWSFSVLPVLVGTTLPFWLDPPGYYFRWVAAFEFCIATVLFQSGFSFLHARFQNIDNTKWTRNRLFLTGILCLIAAVLIGIHLNNNLNLNTNVHKSIFLVFGATAIFIGVLYVVPPFRFCKQIGGEAIFSVGLGMMPVIGAYLVQAGDLHRTVYLASMPLVVSTGLWVWITEIKNRKEDKKAGYTTMVMLFSPQFSGRYITLLISIMIYLTLVLAVFGRSSLNPLSLIAFFSIGLAVKIVFISWNEYANIEKMRKLRKYAFILHFIISIIIILSSLAGIVI